MRVEYMLKGIGGQAKSELQGFLPMSGTPVYHHGPETLRGVCSVAFDTDPYLPKETGYFLSPNPSVANPESTVHGLLEDDFHKEAKANPIEVHRKLKPLILDPVPEQGAFLQSVARGYIRYCWVPVNSPSFRFSGKKYVNCGECT